MKMCNDIALHCIRYYGAAVIMSTDIVLFQPIPFSFPSLEWKFGCSFLYVKVQQQLPKKLDCLLYIYIYTRSSVMSNGPWYKRV